MSDPRVEEEEGFLEEREPEEPEVFEFVDGEVPEEPEADSAEADLPEELRGLSKAELYKRLAAAGTANSAQSLEAALTKLGDRLAPQPAPVQEERYEMPSFELSDEERARFNEEFVDPSKEPYAAVAKYLIPKFKAYSDAGLGLAAGKFAEQEAQILEATSEEYREWKSEIQAFIQTLPAGQRRQPGVHKYALDQVKARNIDKLVAREVAKELAKLQESATSATTEHAKLRVLPPRATSPGGSPVPGGPRKIVISNNDPELVEAMRRAEQRMMLEPGTPMWQQYKEKKAKEILEKRKAGGRK